MDRTLNILEGQTIGKFLIVGVNNDDLIKNCCFDSRMELNSDEFDKNYNQIIEFNEKLYSQIQGQLKEQLINAIKFGYTAINWYVNGIDNTITIEATYEKFDTCDICIYYPISFNLDPRNRARRKLMLEDYEDIMCKVDLKVESEDHFALI